MALIECKECRKMVHVNADPCPQCGVKEPGVSFEEQVLKDKIASAKREEELYVKEFRNATSGILRSIINRKRIVQCTDLANASQRLARELEAELLELQKRKWKKTRENSLSARLGE